MTNERLEYLKGLAEDFNVPLDIVKTAAWMLGPNEDYDGIITTLEDYAEAEDA